jgi:6-phosphogluconolactonase
MENSSQICRWHIYPTADEVQREAVQIIAASAQLAISTRGEFHLVLAGGNTPRAIYEKLRDLKTDWNTWHIYFGDERCLASDHPERNSHMAYAAWLQHVTIPPMQIYMIPAELGSIKGAQEYAKVLRDVGEFDLVLLGLGEDGHTASLFPGQDWGMAPDSPPVLAVHNAPKPPPERISLSAQRLSKARQVVFLVTGASKQQAVAQWRTQADIPACSVAPACGVEVLLEQAATS